MNTPVLFSFSSKRIKLLPFEGNRVAVYTEGYTKLQSLLRELQKAKQHIHMEYYIFEDDAIGRMVRDVLIEKASHGVEATGYL